MDDIVEGLMNKHTKHAEAVEQIHFGFQTRHIYLVHNILHFIRMDCHNLENGTYHFLYEIIVDENLDDMSIPMHEVE